MSPFSLFGKRRTNYRRNKRSFLRVWAQLSLEQLEPRNVLSVTFNDGVITVVGDGISVEDANEVLVVNGHFINDQSTGAPATIHNVNSIVYLGNASNESASIDLDNPIPITLQMGGGIDSLTISGDFGWTVTDSGVTGGPIHVQFSSVEKVMVIAGESPNTIDATAFSGIQFSAFGEGGNDTINGCIHGVNILFGGKDQDRLVGGVYADTLDGGDGGDTLIGGQGGDTLYGGEGRDFLIGDQEDGIPFFDGNDNLYGDLGDDELRGGGGDDYLEGGIGNDDLYGGEDNDTLVGGEGDDKLVGDGGDGKYLGGPGSDFIDGVGGAATFYDKDDESDDYFFQGDQNILFFESPGAAGITINSDGVHTSSWATGVEADDNFVLGTLGTFRQIFIKGNDKNNTFDIGDAGPYITVDPGPVSAPGATFDTLIVRSDAPRVWPTGVLSSYSIGKYTSNWDLIGVIKYDGRGVNAIEFHGGGGNNTFILDQWKSPVSFLDGGEGIDVLGIKRDANMTLKDGELKITAPFNQVIPFGNIESVSLSGGDGNNRLDASAFTGSVSLYGGKGNDTLIGTNYDDYLSDDIGNDTLIGNGGNDKLSGGDGNDVLNGGPGIDQLFEDLSFNGTSKSFTLTNSKLVGRGTDSLQGIEGAELRGLGFDDIFNVGAWTGTGKNLIVGNGGNDTVLVTANADFIVANPQSSAEAQFSIHRSIAAGSSTFLAWDVSAEKVVLTGGASANYFGLNNRDGFTWPSSLTFRGVNGNDKLVYQSASANETTIELSNTKLTDSHNNGQLNLSGLTFADLTTTADVDVSGWTKKGRLEGIDPILVRSSKNANFTAEHNSTGTFLKRSDGASFQLENVWLLDLLGGASANILTLNYDGLVLPKILYDGMASSDRIQVNLKSRATAVLDETPNRIQIQTLEDGAEIKYSNVESIKLMGSPEEDTFAFQSVDSGTDGPKPAYSVNGGTSGSIDSVSFEWISNLNLSVTNTAISLKSTATATPTRTITLANIDVLHLTASDVPDRWIDVSGWTKSATIDFLGAHTTLISAGNTNAVLTNNLLTRSNGASILFTLGAPEWVFLRGGGSANVLDARSYSVGRVKLEGMAGNDTLYGGSAADLLFGGTGNDTLYGGDGADQLFGEDNDDLLDGGDAFDTLDGGKHKDKHRNGEFVFNCEFPWI